MSYRYVYEYNTNGDIVGRGRLYLIRNKLHKQPYGLIEDIYINRDYRNKRIGKKLVKKLINIAKSEKCYKIIATSRFERDNVHIFYKDLGFKKWGYEFRMDLE